MTVRQIGDGIRAQIGKPLTRQAIQRHLDLLQDFGFADSTGDRGKPNYWWAIPPEGVQQGATNVQP